MGLLIQALILSVVGGLALKTLKELNNSIKVIKLDLMKLSLAQEDKILVTENLDKQIVKPVRKKVAKK